MTQQEGKPVYLCPEHAGAGHANDYEHIATLEPDEDGIVRLRCAAHGGGTCSASVILCSNTTEIRVSGTSHEEVAHVARLLANDARDRKKVQALRSPWVSGSFYLACAVIAAALMLVIGSVLPVWTIAVFIVGAIMIVSVVGALQLRQDERISERGFLALMKDTLRYLPRLPRHLGDGAASQDLDAGSR